MVLERKDTTADGGNSEAGDEILGLPAWLQCETPRLPAGLLVHPSPGLSKMLMLLSSENKSKVTAWEMSFQNYPLGRTKQTMPNVLALNVWHLIGIGAGHSHSGLQMY